MASKEGSESEGQIVLVAIFQARQDTVAALRGRLVEMVGLTRAEQGCIQYDLHEYSDDPLRFAFIETWASRADLAAHDETAHVRAIVADVPQLAQSPIEIHRLRPIGQRPSRS